MARTKTTPSTPRKTAHAAETLTPDLFDQAPSEAPSAEVPPPLPPPGGNGGTTGDDDFLPLAQFAERSYLEYAMSVVMGRALPDVADGAEAGQRRIHFTMAHTGQ